MLSMDESGDCNSVTIEIFKLLKADIKIMAGDQYQNIYGFNNTINGFKSMENQGILTTLTKTFRVSANIASKIESFAKEYIDENFVFIGNNYEEKTENSIAYISRNNSALIDKMISLDKNNTPYNLTRSPQKMFEVPLTILGLKPYKDVLNKEYKFLEKDAIDFHEDKSLEKEYGTLFKYIMNKHSDDIAIKSACNLIMKHGPGKIFETYDNAKNHAVGENKHLITLTTAHSSKGLTFDTVHIMSDLNESLSKTIKEAEELMYLTNLKTKDKSEHVTLKDCMNQYQLESMLLYYVATSRCRHRLYNAEHLMAGNFIE
jgi:ATP-dependent exoDNAse (exonuclease V) beta subunit